MFLPNTETDKSRNTDTETYYGREIWPKPNRNDIRLSTIPDGMDVVVVEGVCIVADGLPCGAVQRVVGVHRQPVQRGALESLRPGAQFNRNIFGLSFGLKNHLSFGSRFPTL